MFAIKVKYIFLIAITMKMLFTVENHGGILKWKSKFDRPMLGALFLPPNRTVQDIGSEFYEY